MSTAPIALSGLSSYSSDLQSILSRQVSISQLPLKRLQNSDSTVLQQKQALVALNPAVSDLATSIANLAKVGTSKGLSVSSSDTSLVSVSNTGSTNAGSYSISNIASIATAASETSATGYADSSSSQVSSAGNLNLVLGSKTYNIALDSGKNNLVGLRDAINNLGLGVTASILTTGTGANPNYLSVQSASTGATTLQLNDVAADGTSTNLITSANQGSDAKFNLNGVAVQRSSNLVNDVVPGVTFTLLAKPSSSATSVNLTLASDHSQLSSALQDFATKYNALADQTNSHVGQSGGALNGDFLIRQIQGNLQQTANYYTSSAGSVHGLADLGISFDSSGKASFDSTAFSGFSNTQISDGFKFLGSTTTGFGALAKPYTQLSDPISGLIKIQEDGYDRSDKSLNSQITSLTQQISAFQSAYTVKVQAADAALANLESQQKGVTAAVQAVNLALYGKTSN